MSDLPRNVRLSNPGNIDRTTIHWVGMSALQDDPRFVRFIAPQYGFRAMARILRHDYAEGLTSVHALINRWAPSCENDCVAYVTDVAGRMNVDPDETLTLSTQLLPLLRSIAHHEGGCPWADSVIQLGIDLERFA